MPDVELKPQVYKDPRPKEYFDQFHQRVRNGEPEPIYEVVRVSTGASAAWELRVPRILAGDFAPGGTIDISYKDQELETAFAKRLRVPLLLANLTQQVYQMARAQGLNKQDGSAIVKIFEQMAGVTVKGD